MTGKALSANLSLETGSGSDSTPKPREGGSVDVGVAGVAVTATSEAAIALKTIRDICHREGHGRFAEVTSPADHPFRIHWCRRGCGTRVVDAPRGLTVPELWQAMERLGMTAAKIDEASFVLDPTDESETP